MGWASYYVGTRFTAKDKQRELDRKFTWSEKGKQLTVVKSSMVGTTYYAAVRCTRDDGYDHTFGVVTLTQMKKGEFYYKDMDESEGPYSYKCPVGILKLLSPTDNRNEKEWRERCLEYHKSLKTSRKVKIGDVYECSCGYPISWRCYYNTIQKGEKFYVKYESYYGHKYFLIATKTKSGFSSQNRKISRSLFNALEKTFVTNINEENK